MSPIKLLYDVKQTEIVLDMYCSSKTLDMERIALFVMVSKPSKKGLVKMVDGKMIFTENKQGPPVVIGEITTDGYDYVYDYGGRVYITHNKATEVVGKYRNSLTDEDEKVLYDLKINYSKYLKTLNTK